MKRAIPYLLLMMLCGCVREPGTSSAQLEGHIVGNGGDPNETLFDQARVPTTRVLKRFASEDTKKIARSVGPQYRESDIDELKALTARLSEAVIKSIHHWDEKLPAGCPTSTCGCTLENQPGHIYFSHVNCRSYQTIRQASRNLLHEAFHSVAKATCERARVLTALAFDLWTVRGATEDASYVPFKIPPTGYSAYPPTIAAIGEEILVSSLEGKVFIFNPALGTWRSEEVKNESRTLGFPSGTGWTGYVGDFPAYPLGRHLAFYGMCEKDQRGVLYNVDTRTFSAIPGDALSQKKAYAVMRTVLDSDRLFAFGGRDCRGLVNQGEPNQWQEGQIYSRSKNSWEDVAPDGPKEASQKTQAIWTGEEVILWGGMEKPGGAAYNPTTKSWRELSKVNQPSPRMNHLLTWSGKQMVVYGGVCWDESDEHFDGEDCTHRPRKDGATYHPETDSWEPFESSNGPLPVNFREGFSSAWMGNELVVMDEDFLLRAFDPSSKTWRTLSYPKARASRFFWTGAEIVVPAGDSIDVLYP